MHLVKVGLWTFYFLLEPGRATTAERLSGEMLWSHSILRIPPAYYSRVSNQRIMEHTGQQQLLSKRVQQQQMMFLGWVARQSLDDPVQIAIFGSSGYKPRLLRKVGRPRITWGHTVYEECLNLVGSTERLLSYWRPRRACPGHSCEKTLFIDMPIGYNSC